MNNEILLDALHSALEKGEYTNLENLAKEAVKETPDEAIGYYCLAEANWLKEKYNNAEVCMAKAIELDDKNVNYLLRLADFKMAQLAWDDARLLYSKALDLEPDNLQTLGGLARYFIEEAGDFQLGIEYLNRIIAAQPENPENWLLRAQAEFELNLLDEALEDVQQALELNPSEAAVTLKINILLDLNELDEVKESYEQLLSLQTENHLDYRISYGNYLLSYDFCEEAEMQFRKALEMSGDTFDGPLTGLLGLSLAGQSKYKEALVVFDEMVEKTPDDEEIYIQRANVHRALGDKKAALQDLKTATAMLSGEIQQLLYYKQAQLYMEFEDWDEAIKICQELAESELFKEDATYKLGEALYKSGDVAAAFKAMRQAQKLKHPSAKAFLQEHFAPQLKQIQDKILAQYAAEIPKNQSSSLLKACFGQFCKFDPYRNKPAGNLPADFVTAILDEISDTGLLLTANGLLLLNPIEMKPLLATYRIEEEDEKEAVIEVIPLDGSSPFTAILAVEGKVVEFEPQLRKAQKVVFKLSDPQKLSDADKMVIQDYIAAEDIEFLGEAANAFKGAVFG